MSDSLKSFTRDDLARLRERADSVLTRLQDVLEDIEFLLELDATGTSNCGIRLPHPQHRWMSGRETWVCPGREEGDL